MYINPKVLSGVFVGYCTVKFGNTYANSHHNSNRKNPSSLESKCDFLKTESIQSHLPISALEKRKKEQIYTRIETSSKEMSQFFDKPQKR